MKLGITIALLVGLLFGTAGLAFGHDADGNPNPPPTNCAGFCKEAQCSCVKGCDAMGKKAGDPCYMDCYQELLACGGRCNLTLEDCRNTDRCAKPRG